MVARIVIPFLLFHSLSGTAKKIESQRGEKCLSFRRSFPNFSPLSTAISFFDLSILLPLPSVYDRVLPRGSLEFVLYSSGLVFDRSNVTNPLRRRGGGRRCTGYWGSCIILEIYRIRSRVDSNVWTHRLARNPTIHDSPYKLFTFSDNKRIPHSARLLPSGTNFANNRRDCEVCFVFFYFSTFYSLSFYLFTSIPFFERQLLVKTMSFPGHCAFYSLFAVSLLRYVSRNPTVHTRSVKTRKFQARWNSRGNFIYPNAVGRLSPLSRAATTDSP